MHTDPATFTEAIEVCNKAGGRLATADDDRELVQMHSMGEDRFLFGNNGAHSCTNLLTAFTTYILLSFPALTRSLNRER